MSFFNTHYSDMKRKINAFLKSAYSDKELIKMKDCIRGLQLQGLLSNAECDDLLLMLPSIGEEYDESADVEECEEHSNNPSFFSSYGKDFSFDEDDNEYDEPQVPSKSQFAGFDNISAKYRETCVKSDATSEDYEDEENEEEETVKNLNSASVNPFLSIKPDESFDSWRKRG